MHRVFSEESTAPLTLSDSTQKQTNGRQTKQITDDIDIKTKTENHRYTQKIHIKAGTLHFRFHTCR